MQANTLSGVARKGSSLCCLLEAGLFFFRSFFQQQKESTSGLDRASVLLPLLQQEQRCQKGIPAAWRHDIIYLFCTILPPSSHHLSFLESVCARVEAEEQNVFLWHDGLSQQMGFRGNNRLIEGESSSSSSSSDCFVPAGGVLLTN